MGKRIAIVQSNYIPWKGYFDLIRQVDEFILYDEVQYTRRDWRNRNRIKTARGPQWLTIPVDVKGKYTQTIRETRVSAPDWGRDHWLTLRGVYARAPHFRRYADEVEALYADTSSEYLSPINRRWLAATCGWLGIATPLTDSADYPAATEGASERLLEICMKAGADEYVSGPAARCYLDVELFEKAGVRVAWAEYAGYPEYPQLHPPFEHAVTALDLIFMAGSDAVRYLDRTEATRAA